MSITGFFRYREHFWIEECRIPWLFLDGVWKGVTLKRKASIGLVVIKARFGQSRDTGKQTCVLYNKRDGWMDGYLRYTTHIATLYVQARQTEAF